MPPGDTPSRLRAFKKLREDMDAELAKSIDIEEAMEKGLVESGDCYAIRIWQNCIDAIAACKALSKRGGVLVRRREGRDVQPWAKPETEQEAEA
jgi:hypothetical protein